MNELKLVIFDMDGLMLDSETIYLKAAMSLKEKYTYDLDEAFIISTMGLTKALTNELLTARMPDIDLNLYNQRLHEEIEKYPLKMKKGLMELLNYLKDNKYLISVATSTYKQRAYMMLDTFDLVKYFDFILTGDMVNKSKPNPDIYLKVLDHFKIKNDEAIVLEDSNNGLLAAINADIKTIYVKDLATVKDETLAQVTFKTNDLLEVKDLLEKEYN